MPITQNSDVSLTARDGNHHYFNYGLSIGSSVAFPELTEAPNGLAPDVTIRKGKVPDSLPEVSGRGVLFEASDQEFLLRIENVAGFLVSRGEDIVVDPAPGADENAVRLFLLGSAMGALLHQRGLLPLHGSAVRVSGRAVLFLGFSGHGKSTVAAALSQRGHPILADDITAVTVEGGTAVALPGYPQLKLWADSLRTLGEKTEGLRRVRADEKMEKFAFPLRDRFCAEPVPIERVYVLRPRNAPDVELQLLQGVARLRALLHNTYRPRYVAGLDRKSPHFAKCSALARQAPVTRVFRPTEPFRLEPLLLALEEDWAACTT